jgi:hypothetical protein
MHEPLFHLSSDRTILSAMAKDTTDTGGSPIVKRRGGRPKALAASIERVTRPLFGKRGLADGAIVRQWAAIVGPDFARLTAPEKLVFPGRERAGGTLHLRVAHGAIATTIQHQEPVIIERINGFFGFRAVARLSLKQGPVTQPPPLDPPRKTDLPPAEEQELSDSLAGVEDPDLRDVLESLGRLVRNRDREKSSS